MAEYIEREATKKEFNIHFGDVHDAVIANRIIDSIPAADVAPVVHGLWVRLDAKNGIEQFKCSVCRSECYVPTCMYEPMYGYCPNCGAKMDGERRTDD